MFKPLILIWRDPALRMAAAAVMLVGCLAATMTPYQSLIAIRLFGLSDSAYALVLAVASAVAVAGSVGIGILTDQTAQRRAIAAWSAGLGIFGALLVLALPGKVSFVLAHALVLPLASSVFGQIFALARLASQRFAAADRDGIMAAVRALFALPFIVVLPLWSVAFDAGAGLLTIYAVLAALGLVLVRLLTAHWPRAGALAAETRSGLSLSASLAEMGRPAVLVRVALTGAIGSGVFMYMVILGLAFDAAPGRDIGDVAIFAGLIAGLEVPVMLSMGLLLARMGRLQAILLGAACYAGFLFAFPALLPTPWVWLLTIPAAVGGGIVLSLPIAYVQDLMGTRAGAGGALLAVQKVASDTLCAALFAVATWVAGYGLAAVLAGVAMLAAAFALILLDRPQLSKNPGPA
ncbi:putative integral membrane transporter protein [Oceanicola granulosus HTCC2516]|uniref:Putative integral membrane transporter protein n=1 Tax=Oceanicola granulosus (strain ATCC BAA-861 / DSM 15982 / KCTC 12143 / HTCC2516) TaxID=314256 RepID=Q2CDN3_OCEGH|nr:hypothetical protein [Oceanicola granulosus]EAR50817.1 putative integral membrane transporter protein [Oceanicola granulosus HTCC2516]